MIGPSDLEIEVIVSVNGKFSQIRTALPLILGGTYSYGLRVTVLGKCCDKETTEYLLSVAQTNPKFSFLAPESLVETTNDIIRKTTAKYICLIGNIIIVPEKWLDNMYSVLIRQPSARAVVPISNFHGNVTAPFPPGCTLNTMDCFFKTRMDIKNPKLFLDLSPCVLIEPDYIRKNGYLDESYQTLNWSLLEFSIANTGAGPQAVLAEQVYVYQFPELETTATNQDRRHFLAKSRSKRNLKKLRRHNEGELKPIYRELVSEKRWSPLTTARETYRNLRSHYQRGDYIALAKIAAAGLVQLPKNSTATANKRFTNRMVCKSKLRVTYVLHNLTVAGGVISVVQLANELVLLGVEVRVVALYQYPETREWMWLTQPIIFKSPTELINNFPASDIALATHWTTADWVAAVVKNGRAKTSAYFLQDYETWFYPESDAKKRWAVLSTYSVIDNKIVKSNWLKNLIQEDGFSSHKILLGLDLSIFYPRDVPDREFTTIVAMARPGTPRRGFCTLVAALTLIKAQYPSARIILFGENIYNQNIPFVYEGMGVISSPEKMAELYSMASIFIDASDFQGFGRTAVEAMACNTACILTNVGGLSEYAVHNVNCILAPPGDPESLFKAFCVLMNDTRLFHEILENGLKTARRFSHKNEARETLAYFESLI